MHVSTKDSGREGGQHLLTSIIEADGAFELCKADDTLSGEVLSVTRTVSGGIEVIVNVEVNKPKVVVEETVAD